MGRARAMARAEETREEKADSTHLTSCGTEDKHRTIGVNGMEIGGNPEMITVGQVYEETDHCLRQCRWIAPPQIAMLRSTSRPNRKMTSWSAAMNYKSPPRMRNSRLVNLIVAANQPNLAMRHPGIQSKFGRRCVDLLFLPSNNRLHHQSSVH